MATKEDRLIEDAPFDVPKFEEKEFIRKELISFKTTLVLFVFGLTVSVITFFIWRSAEIAFFPLLLVAIATGVLLLKYIFKATRIDVTHWKRKEWFGTYVLYFFFWLGFFLLFTNPPISDAATPVANVAVSPAVQAPGNVIAMGAFVADNVGMDAESLEFCLHPLDSGEARPRSLTDLTQAQRTACRVEWDAVEGEPAWRYEVSRDQEGHYAWFVAAMDVNGQSVEASGLVEFGSPFRVVAPPRDDRFEHPDDSFSVRVKESLLNDTRAVQYSVDNGVTFHNFQRDPDATKATEGWWRTDPTFEGWNIGDNEVHLRVQTHPSFVGNGVRVPSAGESYAWDTGGPYNVTVRDAFPGLNEESSPTFGERVFLHPGQTPGIGFPLVVVAVAALVFVRQRVRHA